MVSFALSYPRLFASAGIAFFFLLSYPLPPDSWGYDIGFLALIPAAARLLGVSWFPSLSHTLACLLLRVSHSFSRSHTRYCPAPGGIMVSFALSYPRLFASAGIAFFFSLSYPLLPSSWGYHNLFLNFIPTISDNIYTIRYLPQITLTLNEMFCLYNSENTRRY